MDGQGEWRRGGGGGGEAEGWGWRGQAGRKEREGVMLSQPREVAPKALPALRFQG